MIRCFELMLLIGLANPSFGLVEDDFDSVVNIFYDGIEPEDLEYPTSIDEEQPKLQHQKWMCGNCINLHTLAKLYHEDYDIELRNSLQNINQVSLSVDGMQCITIHGERTQDLNVRRISGACSGDFVILEVYSNRIEGSKFTVEVFGQ